VGMATYPPCQSTSGINKHIQGWAFFILFSVAPEPQKRKTFAKY